MRWPGKIGAAHCTLAGAQYSSPGIVFVCKIIAVQYTERGTWYCNCFGPLRGGAVVCAHSNLIMGKMDWISLHITLWGPSTVGVFHPIGLCIGFFVDVGVPRLGSRFLRQREGLVPQRGEVLFHIFEALLRHEVHAPCRGRRVFLLEA